MTIPPTIIEWKFFSFSAIIEYKLKVVGSRQQKNVGNLPIKENLYLDFWSN